MNGPNNNELVLTTKTTMTNLVGKGLGMMHKVERTTIE
jgi:hypothetical protein